MEGGRRTAHTRKNKKGFAGVEGLRKEREIERQEGEGRRASAKVPAGSSPLCKEII